MSRQRAERRRVWRRWPSRLRAAGLAVLTLAGCFAGAGTTQALAADPSGHGTPKPLVWGSCPQDTAGAAPVTRDPRLQCARLAVPLDHRRPNGPHIAIEVSRIRSGAAHPLALMVGQGGPGFGGLDLPSAEETALPPEVAARTDIYGMDYRGIGASSPLDCDIAPADRSEATGVPYPAADGSIDANTAWAARIAADCAAHAGDELRYVNTVNIARDINSLRVALGLPTLSYTGTSYGTFVGAVYASLYPTTSGRVLLNSVVPPGGVKEAIEHKGQAVETAFPPFADWVAARDATYHLGATRTAVRSAVLATAEHLNSHPIPLTDGAPLTGNLLLEAQEALLEQRTYYPLLAGLLKDARTGSLPSGSGSDLPWSQLLTDNFVSAQDAVVCNDSAWPRDPAHYRTAVTRNAARYPLTAGSPRNVWPCAFWTTRTSDRAPTPNPHGPANILLLQNTADPSTAPSGAVATRKAFGHRAALVTVDAVGHGVDMTQPCVAEQVTRFLLHPGPPRPATCPGIRRQTP